MLAGTLVTAIGFMPNGFARSTAGEYTSNMFWIVGIALIASWIVAVVFTPYLGVKLLPNIEKREGGHEAIYNTPRYNRFRQLLGVVIRRKWLVAGSVRRGVCYRGVGPGPGEEAVLPDLRSTGSAGRSADAVRHLDRADECRQRRRSRRGWPEQPEAKIVTAYVGQGAPRFYLAMAPELPDPSFAKIVVLTASEEAREALRARLQTSGSRRARARRSRAELPQLVFGPYSPFPVAFRVMGPDPDKLRDLAEQVRAVMQASPLMRTVNSDLGRARAHAAFFPRSGQAPEHRT